MTTAKLNKALIEARKDISNPAFDSMNPHFKNKFASLKAVVDAVIPPLAEHGIAVMQDLQTADDGSIMVFTHLCHESGEEKVLGPLKMRPTKSDPQGQGSAATYGRRYHLMAVGGVVGDEDDDANAASEPAFKTKQMKTKVWKAIRDAAAEEDGLKARETWDELNNDQREEIWRELSSGQRSTLKQLLNETHEEVA